MARVLLPRYVLWLDPGTTTGWALLYTWDLTLVQEEYDWDHGVRALEAWMRSAGRDTALGCERFVITPDSARRPGSVEALQMWGAARSAASRHRARLFLDHQVSATAVGGCPDDVLRALGWYKNTMRHANDAARHVYAWLASEGVLPPELRARVISLLEQEGTHDG